MREHAKEDGIPPGGHSNGEMEHSNRTIPELLWIVLKCFLRLLWEANFCPVEEQIWQEKVVEGGIGKLM